jgi:hypothetical protein
MPAQTDRISAHDARPANIAREHWNSFLDAFNRKHRGWLVRFETYDVVTRERVLSQEAPLQSVELDMEDAKNPRINVTVHDGNKVIKHILFRPSSLASFSSDHDQEQLLKVDTVNTETTVRLRAPAR